jgi:hypothetical protein
LRLTGEMHRFIPLLAEAQDFKTTEIEVDHRPRRWGSSKYGLERLPRSLIDLFVATALVRLRRRPATALWVISALSLATTTAGLAAVATFDAVLPPKLAGPIELWALIFLTIVASQLLFRTGSLQHRVTGTILEIVDTGPMNGMQDQMPGAPVHSNHLQDGSRNEATDPPQWNSNLER